MVSGLGPVTPAQPPKSQSSRLNPLPQTTVQTMSTTSKKRKLSIRNTSGFTGVSKKGKKFTVMITVASKKKQYIGIYPTAQEAAVAYDHAVIQYRRPRSWLNFPDTSYSDVVEYDETVPRKTRLHSTNTIGYRGVAKNGKGFQALLTVDGKKKGFGTYPTTKQAALAYDKAVVKHGKPRSWLNCPDELDDAVQISDKKSSSPKKNHKKNVQKPGAGGPKKQTVSQPSTDSKALYQKAATSNKKKQEI